MVTAVLKLYFFGTALSILAVFFGIMDSFGGLMYVQDHRYALDQQTKTQKPASSSNHQRGASVTKRIGS